MALSERIEYLSLGIENNRSEKQSFELTVTHFKHMGKEFLRFCFLQEMLTATCYQVAEVSKVFCETFLVII